MHAATVREGHEEIRDEELRCGFLNIVLATLLLVLLLLIILARPSKFLETVTVLTSTIPQKIEILSVTLLKFTKTIYLNIHRITYGRSKRRKGITVPPPPMQKVAPVIQPAAPTVFTTHFESLFKGVSDVWRSTG